MSNEKAILFISIDEAGPVDWDILIEKLKEVEKDHNVKNIVISIDSPGVSIGRTVLQASEYLQQMKEPVPSFHISEIEQVERECRVKEELVRIIEPAKQIAEYCYLKEELNNYNFRPLFPNKVRPIKSPVIFRTFNRRIDNRGRNPGRKINPFT